MTSHAGETIAHRICPICEACCGLELTIADGHVTGIRGYDEDVFSGGYICPKGGESKERHQDPARPPKQPARRVVMGGGGGGGVFVGRPGAPPPGGEWARA